MAYIDDEKSVQDGQPVELFHFYDTASQEWFYTSAGYDITYNGDDYLKDVMSHSEPRQTNEFIKQEMVIRVPRNNLLLQEFKEGPPEAPIKMIMYRGHGSNFVGYWRGKVMSGRWEGDEGFIKIASAAVSMNRTGIRPRYSIHCRHDVYGDRCKLIRAVWVKTGLVSAVSGVTISSTTFSSYANGYFQGGELVIGSARRLIIAHSGSNVTINRAMPSTTQVGDSFYAYPGCNHTWDHCKNKFSNSINFGGKRYLPVQKNPFKGRFDL